MEGMGWTDGMDGLTPIVHTPTVTTPRETRQRTKTAQTGHKQLATLVHATWVHFIPARHSSRPPAVAPPLQHPSLPLENSLTDPRVPPQPAPLASCHLLIPAHGPRHLGPPLVCLAPVHRSCSWYLQQMQVVGCLAFGALALAGSAADLLVEPSAEMLGAAFWASRVKL
jgi:hypothetical protein